MPQMLGSNMNTSDAMKPYMNHDAAHRMDTAKGRGSMSCVRVRGWVGVRLFRQAWGNWYGANSVPLSRQLAPRLQLRMWFSKFLRVHQSTPAGSLAIMKTHAQDSTEHHSRTPSVPACLARHTARTGVVYMREVVTDPATPKAVTVAADGGAMIGGRGRCVKDWRQCRWSTAAARVPICGHSSVAHHCLRCDGCTLTCKMVLLSCLYRAR